ncbi:unnamed protein product [Prorocentrum cordatum]|uniref:Uncharacterized protein n=1 Tax=Prorocentrum cordatum TaxID=2364126 RepID=A0ABN9QDW7_9DINO|nr:unnamed protein product [Polarella glacialis]
MQDEVLQNEDLQSEEVLNEQLHYSHHKDSVDPGVLKEELHDEDSMASHPGSSTTGRLSNAVVSSAVTEDECQAARDWALPVSMSAPFGVSYTDSRDRSFSVGLRLFMHTGCKWELKVPRRMICNKGVLRVLLPGVH